jgi:uncharacterized delta-60 repeat protein
MKRTAQIYLIIVLTIFNLKGQSSWTPNPTFGDNGITRVNFGSGYNDNPNDILLLPDGKILTAGQSTSSFDYFIAVSQLLPDGQPDISGFGSDGKVSLHFVLRDHANDIEIQPDGKILVAGTEAVGNGSSQVTPAIYRFESDGTLDTTFADSGKAVHRFSGNLAGEMYGVKVLSDGRILIAGFRTGSAAFGLMRFMPNGERDFSFGSNGEAVLPSATTFHPVGCLFLGDTIVVFSTVAFTSGMSQFVLGMMDSSGNPVPTFGNNGIVLTGIEGKYNFSGGESLSLTSDNKLILAGTTPDSGPTRFSVFRFALNGTIDSTFGTNGRTDVEFGSGSDILHDMKIDNDGKILLVGEGNNQAGLARLNSDGSPDTTFASGGWFVINLNNNSGTHYLTKCMPLDNGDILVAGWDFASNAGDFMIVKLTQNPTGINDENSSLPENFELSQNYPNPFNPTTTIQFSLPQAGDVTLKVYNLLGEEVKTLINEYKQIGNHSIQFNANNLASGIYFYRLQAGSFIETKKMILMK